MQSHALSLFPEVIGRVIIEHSAHFSLLNVKNRSSILYPENRPFFFLLLVFAISSFCIFQAIATTGLSSNEILKCVK